MDRFQQFSDLNISKWQLARTILLTRLVLLFAMAVSCHFIPDHNPGDDVLRFHLRLRDKDNSCFCLAGYSCDTTGVRHAPADLACADLDSSLEIPSKNLVATYQFILNPITKWDSARFLTLAADRSMRYPLECSDDEVCEDRFMLSEQQHAFLPLFPWLIQNMAKTLTFLPKAYLPPTYEGQLALSAWILNLLFFLLATFGLYDLTSSVCNPKLAMASCLVFAINPASVFFSSAYSESLFAMCTFGGHALAARGMVTAAVVPWTAASYTRANGTINSAWLLLRGISSGLNGKSILDGLLRLLYHIILAVVVALPVRYHDVQGYDLHCSSSQEFQPTWCEEDRTTFSLYSWTQRRHWNVGFLRYYHWKQVPNFLLAAPILFLGFWAVYLWIDSSMKGYVKDKRMSLELLVPWAFDSLRRSIPPPQTHSSLGYEEQLLLKNPYLLGHYAVLAAVCSVGLTIAHIQISTRLICSSCPAMIWFLSDRIIKRDRLGVAVLAYCGLYILLGVILYVNFLPWT